MSCTCSTYARLAAPISRRSAGCSDERAQRFDERFLRRGHDRHTDAEAGRAPVDDLGLQVGEHGLAERHRLEREDAVPARVQLVDDDVGPRVAGARLLVGHAFDDVEVDRQLLARLDHVAGALLLAVRRRVHDERPRVVGRRDGCELAQVEPGRDDVRLGHPADRVEAADDLRVRAFAVRELLGRLAADVGAEVVEDALLAQQRAAAGTASTSGSASGRSRSGRCRSAARAARTRRTAARASPAAARAGRGSSPLRDGACRARRRRGARRSPSAGAPARSPTGCRRCSPGSA